VPEKETITSVCACDRRQLEPLMRRLAPRIAELQKTQRLVGRFPNQPPAGLSNYLASAGAAASSFFSSAGAPGSAAGAAAVSAGAAVAAGAVSAGGVEPPHAAKATDTAARASRLRMVILEDPPTDTVPRASLTRSGQSDGCPKLCRQLNQNEHFFPGRQVCSIIAIS